MRKISFTIDDCQYFRNEFQAQRASKEQIEEIMNCMEDSFQAVYTLYGKYDSKSPDHYTLTDFNGGKIDINSLNGYQRGLILGECMEYFKRGKCAGKSTGKPCGVVNIEESFEMENSIE